MAQSTVFLYFWVLLATLTSCWSVALHHNEASSLYGLTSKLQTHGDDVDVGLPALISSIKQVITDQQTLDAQYIQEADDAMPEGADVDAYSVQEKLDAANTKLADLKVELEKYSDVTSQIKFLADLVDSSKLSDDMRAEAYQKEKIVYTQVRTNGLRNLGQLNSLAGDYEEKTEWWKRHQGNSEQLLTNVNDLRTEVRSYLGQWETLHEQAEDDWNKVYSADQQEISFFVQKHSELSSNWMKVKEGYEQAVAERESLLEQLKLAQQIEAEAEADENWEQRHWRAHLTFITDWYSTQTARTDQALKTVNSILALVEPSETSKPRTSETSDTETELNTEAAAESSPNAEAEASTTDDAAKEATTLDEAVSVADEAASAGDDTPVTTTGATTGETAWSTVTNTADDKTALLEVLERNARPAPAPKSDLKPFKDDFKDHGRTADPGSADLDSAMLELERFASLSEY